MVRLLLGIGNLLKGDDGAGTFIVTQVHEPGWIALDCGTVPENFTGRVREISPELLVLVDAAEMNIPPGEFRVVAPEDIDDVAFGTHALPLRLLIDYVRPHAGRILFIGIQPEQTSLGAGLSPSVKRGARRLALLIETEEFEKIMEFIQEKDRNAK
ncbi:MAG: hydrogenase 3 maturation endopeptidase HyCI, partial [Methanoregulaceae archaeon]|nr:hydrogenase 3 maturation endopeptidase HyCI [Methanoregulaceae archaeon]